MIGQKLKTAPPTGGHVFQRIVATFELNQDIIKTHILTNFELGRDFIGTKLLTKFHEDGTRNQMLTDGRTDGRTYDGQRPVTKAHLSNQKNAPPTGGHVFSLIPTIFKLVPDINKTNVLTNFYDDWAKIVTSRVFTRKKCPDHWRPCFITDLDHFRTHPRHQLNQCFTNFHDDWAKIVTSRVFTRKTAPPTGGRVFQRIGATFKLNQDIIKTNILTNFELGRDFIGTKLLTKFHEDRTRNVASRVFTSKC
ncbi:hypothetical protein DPMN_188950 [Dreissena polymorpha]|uniref:Uncharacterized protein n=1 Tax=Dreissena polymorpha TaxID=45954 RepID=A0A9D4IAI8_DREPO|nr:hypothetical protein DPMN_188950 [Dreissena polymorpha]